MNDAGNADATTDSAHGAEAAADSAAAAADGEHADRAGAATDASARSCATRRCTATPTFTTPPLQYTSSPVARNAMRTAAPSCLYSTDEITQAILAGLRELLNPPVEANEEVHGCTNDLPPFSDVRNLR